MGAPAGARARRAAGHRHLGQGRHGGARLRRREPSRPAGHVVQGAVGERAGRDYLWRIHANVPQGGEIGVFDRSHYEDVIAVRVFDLVPEGRWRKRYDHINGFEQLLADEGTTIVKVLLHISKDEQKRRLERGSPDRTSTGSSG